MSCVPLFNRGHERPLHRTLLSPAGKELQDARVVQCRVARGVLVDGHLLPRPAGGEDCEEVGEGCVRADRALRSPLGQRQRGQDKCGKLWGAELHGTGRRSRLGRRVALFTEPRVSSCDERAENRLSP